MGEGLVSNGTALDLQASSLHAKHVRLILTKAQMGRINGRKTMAGPASQHSKHASARAGEAFHPKWIVARVSRSQVSKRFAQIIPICGIGINCWKRDGISNGADSGARTAALMVSLSSRHALFASNVEYSSTGSASYSKCPPGRFGNSAGQTSKDSCGQCDAGKYSDTEGATKCDTCTRSEGITRTGRFCLPGVHCRKVPLI
jgi:hypothetical protein